MANVFSFTVKEEYSDSALKTWSFGTIHPENIFVSPQHPDNADLEICREKLILCLLRDRTNPTSVIPRRESWFARYMSECLPFAWSQDAAGPNCVCLLLPVTTTPAQSPICAVGSAQSWEITSSPVFSDLLLQLSHKAVTELNIKRCTVVLWSVCCLTSLLFIQYFLLTPFTDKINSRSW